MSQDNQIDPRTGVPHNLLGATTLEELASLEANITTAAIYQLQLEPTPGDYDLVHLQTIHASIFRDVYPWAGSLRTQMTNRGELFTPPADISGMAERLFDHLAELDHLRGLQPAEFAGELSACYAWLNSIHPFSDGNGRAQRLFFGQMARDAGYEIRWERLDRQIESAICREAMYENSEALPVVFAHLIEPTQPVFGSSVETARQLEYRARQTSLAAMYTAARTDQLSDHPPLHGRLAATYVQARAEVTDKALDIAIAKAAREAYTEGIRDLGKLEQEQARLLAPPDPTLGNKRASEGRSPEQRCEAVAGEIQRERARLAVLAVQVAEAEIAAGPVNTWDYYEDIAIDLQANWDKYMIYAELKEQQAIVDLEHLTRWLNNHAEQLSQTAANLESGLTTPAEIGVPIAAALGDLAPRMDSSIQEPPSPRMGL